MRDFIACVASVSSRGSSRKLWQEQKKKKNDGGGGGNPGVICSLCFYFDELSIYKWTEPWNFKGRFPESWGLRASVSFSSHPFLLPLFCSRSNVRAVTQLATNWTFKWVRMQCKTCSFINNVNKKSAPRVHLLKCYLWHNLLHAI